MPTPQQIEQALAKVHDQKSFIQELLVGVLEWPIPESVEQLEDISYDWSKEELRAQDLDKKVVDGKAFQFKLTSDQVWGIFLLEFKNADAFITGRGLTSPLRKVLRGLVRSRRKASNLASWEREHLLFICTHAYEHYRFAYFKTPPGDTKTAPLATFGWSLDEPARTACEFNLPDLAWPDRAASAEDWVTHWAGAFDVGKVTEQFYQDYATEFKALRESINALSGEDQKMFTQTMLNRLMFLRFVERKGWLIPPGSERSKDYLRLLYGAGSYCGKSFYIGRLRKLFFEGLAIEGKQQSEAIGKVPFLNGGLFEESELDRKVEDIPDEAFAPILGSDGLFYRYNFTVQESTPLDIEVAVDPEMLGKVFEKLVTGRHESGSYYTPRPIVSFMCREALKGYIADTTEIDSEKIAAFVDKHDVKGITIEGGRKIAKALDEVRTVDPACGSGAYLLGLLHEIVDLYRLLYSEKLKTDARDIHRIKLDIIEKSLYGVDKDAFASNIAMLRLWLSLTVDSDTPEALPNLDFKIETGDSVTGPDPQQFGDLHLHEPARQLAILKGQYMRAHGERKQSLRRLVQKEQRELAFQLRSLYPGAIDWRVQFCEVFFSERGGFDIVLANPPYVRQELIKEHKPALKKVYRDLFSGTADLCVFFYARAVQLLRPGGRLAFISSNKWMRAGYGANLRRFLKQHTRPESVVDFGHSPVFPAADTFPCLPVLAKRGSVAAEVDENDSFAACNLPREHYSPEMSLTRYFVDHARRIPTSSLTANAWSLDDPAIQALIEKIRTTGTPLKELIDGPLYRGPVSGLNDAFYIDDEQRKKLIAADPRSEEVIRPLVRGRDIGRWQAREGGTFILFMRRGTNISAYPAVKSHLTRFRPELEKRAGDQAWYELQASPAEEFVRIMERPKILYQEIQFHSWYCIDTSESCINNKVFMLASDDLALLGVLASPLMWWFLTRTLPHMKDEALCPAGFLMEGLRISTGEEKNGRRLRECVEGLVGLTVTVRSWEDSALRSLTEIAGIGESDDRLLNWLNEPAPSFVKRVAKLAGVKSFAAATTMRLTEAHGRMRHEHRVLLVQQLKLEEKLAELVEDAYGLTESERVLLRSTKPVRDPVDVLKAKIELLGQTGVEVPSPA